MALRCWIIPLIIAVLYLSGCSSTPTQGLTAKWAFAEQREQLARRYESDGALQRALQEWLIISTVMPYDSDSKNEIRRLESLISERVARHRKAAKAALAKSDYASAKLRLLKALALQPNNQQTIAALKKLEARRTYARLKPAPRVSANALQIDTAPTGQPANGAGKNDNLKLAPDNPQQEDTTSRRNKLAEQHYNKGIAAFRAENYERAINEFRMSLKYNPGHPKARLYLETTRELQADMRP